MSRFRRVSDNTCCHGNALNTFSLSLERGAINPMLPQLHIFTKFAEKIMVLILKNNMAAIADLLENQ